MSKANRPYSSISDIYDGMTEIELKNEFKRLTELHENKKDQLESYSTMSTACSRQIRLILEDLDRVKIAIRVLERAKKRTGMDESD